MRQISRAVCLLVSALVALVAIACGSAASPTAPDKPTPTAALPPLDEMLADQTLGDPSKNTIIEYVSFACPGCRTFYLSGEGSQIKSQFVDTRQAQLVFRNLFLGSENRNAAMLARCAGKSRFFDAATTIFQNQASWKGADDHAIAQVMLQFGMSQAVIDSCVATTALRDRLEQVARDALAATYDMPDGTTTIGITYVPAVVVNGVKLDSSSSDNPPTLANIRKYLRQ